MSRLDVTVYLEKDVSQQQGRDCTEMKGCSKCGGQFGIYIFTQNQANCIGFNILGERFDRVIWDHWKCLSCNHQWVERYGVRDGS